MRSLSRDRVSRRDFLRSTTLTAVGASLARRRGLYAGQLVANSVGTNQPAFEAPPGACDSHIHIYDPARFPMLPSPRVAPAEASAAHYRLLQQRVRTSRVVVVTPRNYGAENAVTVDAVRQFGSRARGVAVVRPVVSDAELTHLHESGVRGIRFSLNDPVSAVTSVDMVEPLAARVADLGWHVQFHLEGQQIVEWEGLLRRLTVPMVFDHMGRPPWPAGTGHRSHGVIRDLIDGGRTWVKLSGAYLNSRTGPPYRDATAIARSFVVAAPDRLVWGSDWPHPTEPQERKPNDAALFDLLTEWAPDEPTRRRILVENPARLYGFDSSV